MLRPRDHSESPSTTQLVNPPPEATTSLTGPLFVSACIVLPVIWGIAVHLAFTWFRKKYRADQRAAPVWPDYQI